MIRAIDPIACTGCTLCEKVCPADLFRMKDGIMTIAYPADCCNCLQCKYVCRWTPSPLPRLSRRR